MSARTKHIQIPLARSKEPEQQRFNEAVRQALNMMGGTKDDRVLTVRDVAGGLLNGVKLTGAIVDQTAQPGEGGADVAVPTIPTNVQGFAGMDITFLRWDRASFVGFAYTEVYRFDADNLALAIKVATVTQPQFSEYLGFGKRVFYWIRHVNTKGRAGAFHATGGVELETKPNYEAIQAGLSEQIDESYLAAALRSKIELLNPENEHGVIYVQNQIIQSIENLETGFIQLAQVSEAQAKVIQQVSLITGDSMSVSSVATLSQEAYGQSVPSVQSNAIQMIDGRIRVSGEKWLYTTQPFRVDVNRRYKIRLVVRQISAPTSGGSVVYAGVATMDGNYSALTSGAGTHRYCAGNRAINVGDGKQVLEGIITGEGGEHSTFRPGTVFVRPMFIVNYQGGDGVVEVESVEIRDVTEYAVVEDASRAYVDNVTGELFAERTIKVGADGRVAGIGLIAGGVSGTRLYFSADQIAILPTNPSSVQGALLPFIYDSETGAVMMDTTFIRDLTASKISGGVLNLASGNIRELSVFERFSPPDLFLQRSHLSDDLARQLAWVDPNAVMTGGTIKRSVPALISTTVIGSFLSGGLVQTVRIYGAGPTRNLTQQPYGYIDVQLLRNGQAVTIDGVSTFRFNISSYLTSDEALPPSQRTYGMNVEGEINGLVGAVANNTQTEWRLRIVSTSGLNGLEQDTVIHASVFEAFSSSGGIVAYTSWDGVANKPETATRWPKWSEVDSKPTVFASNWASVADKPETATRWPTLADITYNGDISLHNGEGMRIRAVPGGWARGITAFDNSMSNRMGGAGFGGTDGTLNAFLIGFNSEWWSGGYSLSSVNFRFPTGFDAWIGSSGSSLAFFTNGNGAKRVKAGSLTVSNTYADEAPTDGIFVKGRGVFNNAVRVERNGINTALAVWQEAGHTLELITHDGTHPTLCFHRGGFTATGLRHDGSGLDLLEGPMRASGFQIRNTQAVINGGGSGSFRLNTATGWVEIGSQNSGYNHFIGDGKPYYFSHELQVNGFYRQYATPWSFGNGVLTTNEVRARHIDGGNGSGAPGELFLNHAWSSGHAVRVSSWLVATSRNNDVMARYVAAYDHRARGQLAPWHYGQDVSYEFLESWRHGSIPSSDYSGSMVFRPYGVGNDFSGGPAHKLVFADTGNLYHSRGNNGGWFSLREIARYEENGYLFARSWINMQTTTGLYWNNGTHLWSSSASALDHRSGASTHTEIRLRTSDDVLRGIVYANNANNIGFLNHLGGWSLRVDSNSFVYASRFYAQSSVRYKNIEYRASALDSISRVKAIGQLGVAVGRYKDRERHKLNRWVIAEEIAGITGEAVALDDKGQPDSVDYDQLIPDLYAALANALERLEKLEVRT